MTSYFVKTFYFFKDLKPTQLISIKAWLQSKAKDKSVLGLVILGTEGLNTTLACEDLFSLEKFIGELTQFLGPVDFDIKSSQSAKPPFRKFVVKIRDEIVTLGKPEFLPDGKRSHLSPEEWHKKITQEDVVVIDTRNDYEIEIGTFDKAIDLGMKEFSEFPEKVGTMNSDKEKPHLIFCTGGIRCEKAIFEMQAQGYKEVYQLDGGILNYMEKYPEGHFKGECFVFDSRVAVNGDLEPSSKYSLCPQCGEVGSEGIDCLKCGEESKLCKKCLTLSEDKPEFRTCSKNCNYHYRRDPSAKGPQQKQFYHN